MNSSADNSSEVETSCVVIAWNATIPWDNPMNLISLETKRLDVAIKAVVIMPIMYIIGAPLNIVNMVVFFKQGLNERINLCLFLLSLVDIIYLTFILTHHASRTPDPFTLKGDYNAEFVYMVNNNVRGLYGFGYMSMLISAVVSAERCVCVLFPLRVQRCIRTKVFAIILIGSMCVVGFTRFVVTAKYRAACFYEERTGRKLWQVSVSDYYLQNKEIINVLDGALYGFGLSLGCPLVVLVTTIITAVKLHQIIRWRDRSSSVMSNKEIGVIKMLICLSTEFLILTIPLIFLRVLPMFGSQINPGGHHANMFSILSSSYELSSYASSSVNFFVYYIAGSRYRETLHQLLGCKPSSKQHEACNKSAEK